MLTQAKNKLPILGYRAYTRMDYCLPGKEYRFRRYQMEGAAQLGLGYRAATVLEGFSYVNGHSLPEYLEHAGELRVLANDVTALEGEALAAYDRARAAMRPDAADVDTPH